MKDSYIAGGVVILILILGFIFANRGAEAPVKEELDNKITPSITFSDGKYELDIASSTISWHGEYLKGLAEEGTVNLLSGNFIISDGIYITSHKKRNNITLHFIDTHDNQFLEIYYPYFQYR